MNTEGFPYDMHAFGSGANSDTDPEEVGASNNGEYVDMRNGTHIDVDGNASNRPRKLRGEDLRYANNLPAGNYQCMWRGQVLTYDVEIWCDQLAVGPSLIRVNGVIVLQSLSFGASVADPIQVDSDQRISGGEIVVTAKTLIPLVFNIGDMVSSLISDPNKYFSAFDPKLYEVNLYTNIDTMVYDSHVNLGGGGGLPIGNYQYRMRYVSTNGDRTNLCVATSMIPVVENMSSDSNQFPYAKTFSGNPNPTNNTRYGIKLKFRVTNLFNYDYIEIIRVAWNQGAGIGFNPTATIVARVDVAPNEISIREYVDPGDQNVDPAVPLSDADIDKESVFLEGAKTPRYFDNRLEFGHISVASKLTSLTFEQISGSEVHPVIDNLGKAGYGDLWNYVNRRHYTHGERVGLGIQCFDGAFGKGFTQKVTNGTDVSIPNRREETSATTDLYSYNGVVRAANIDGSVSNTHEVFDLTEAESKSDTCSFKNIYHTGGWAKTGWKSEADVTEDCSETEGQIENHGAIVEAGIPNKVYPFYHPFTPINENDSDVSGHNYVVNTKVSKANHLVPANNEDYRPAGFGPSYYSQGLLLAGVDNFPEWVKGFSVVRTDMAGRVIAQGLGAYFLDPAEFNFLSNAKLTTKSTRKFWFFCPDIENGIVSSGTLNDLIENPLDYSVQFVSPLGFFSEVYNFEKNSLDPDRNRIIDMISYVRMIRDEVGGQINPMEDVNMGIAGGDGFRYVAYDRWRNVGQSPNAFNGPNDGNRIFGVVNVERVTEGRGTYLSLEVDGDVYGRTNVGGVTDREFEDTGLKNWTEPVYVINIVRTGAVPKDDDTTLYKNCTFIKRESIIGRSDGSNIQEYPLVDERWEDAIPALTSSHPTASTDRYVYVKDSAGQVGRWLNVTYKTPAQVAAIATSIINTGTYLGSVGIYTHRIENNDRLFTLVFDYPGLVPAQDDLIMVRYDKTAPIRFWGGDATIGESIFAPIDRECDATDNAASTQFALGLGFPYRTFKVNPRYYIVNRTTGIDRIQDEPWTRLGYLRQLCMMFTVESRGAMPYAFNQSYPIQYFPQINYVIRPHRWDNTKSARDQNIYPEYENDYGTNEITQWGWGGFRFRQSINPEHTNEPQKTYVSMPEFGFEEETSFPYRVIWSLVRAVNVRNAPGIRTFPANNAFDIDDKSGEIKYLTSMISDRGDNLYAFTDSGTCMLLTNKSILSDLNGGELAYMASTAFIKGQYWVSRSIGMSDEWWRSAAEAEVPVVIDESGKEKRIDGVYFGNGKTFFLFINNDHIDIGRAKYFRKIRESLSNVAPGYITKVCGVFFDEHKQYWVNIQNSEPLTPFNRTLMYNQLRGMWTGYNEFKYDRMAMLDVTLHGSRDGETYAADRSFLLNGAPVTFHLDYASAPAVNDNGTRPQKEFIRTAIHSQRDQKPTRVEFYDKAGTTLLCFLDPAQGTTYLKWYGRWEQYIPRKLPNLAGVRYLLQDRVLITRIIHDNPSDFTIVEAGAQFKPLV